MKPASIHPAAILALVLAVAAPAHGSESSASPDSGNPHHSEVHSADEKTAASQPGKPEDVTRTIEVKTLDSMKYDPSSFAIARGETLRLIVTNTGRLRHEATIGTPEEQQTHAEEMASGAVHDSPNSVTVDPGETKELIWRFDQPGRFEIGCHIPGHYQAGMVAEITVH